MAVFVRFMMCLRSGVDEIIARNFSYYLGLQAIMQR